MSSSAAQPSTGSTALLTSDEVATLAAPLRRYVLSRTGDPHRAEDIVQETLARTLAAAENLEIETLTGYAIAVARNEIASHARADATARRHLPRLVDPRQPLTPDEVVTARESRTALAAALAALPDRTRRLLIAHDLYGQPLAEIAAQEKVGSGALAAQLHRTRARLRVDYVIALRHATLPTTRCRPVLLAISAGDLRQQHALDAGEHLAGCEVCDELAVPLVTRDRTLAGLLPWIALGSPHGTVEWWVRAHPRVSAGTAGAATAAAVLAATLLTAGHQPPAAAHSATPAADTSPAPTAPAATPVTTATSGQPGGPAAVPNLSTGGRPVVAAKAELGSATSAPVVATGVTVLAVPGNEGFWIGDSRARIWVQMTGRGESPLQVTVGMRMSFTGTLVANGPTFAIDLKLTDAQDRTALDAIGIHVEVPHAGITVVR